MTEEDILTVVSIISGFRKPPTWADVEKRVRKAGLPFSKEALRRKPKIQKCFSDKAQPLLAKASEERAIAKEEKLAEAEEVKLTELVADLRKQVLELRIAIETVYANAAEQGVPIEDLNRPLKYVDHSRTEDRRPE